MRNWIIILLFIVIVAFAIHFISSCGSTGNISEEITTTLFITTTSSAASATTSTSMGSATTSTTTTTTTSTSTTIFKVPAWTGLGQGTDSAVLAMAADPQNNIYVGGAFGNLKNSNGNGVQGTSHIGKWIAVSSSWGGMGIGLNDTVAAIAVSPLGDYVYAAGGFTAAGIFGTPASDLKYIARWNIAAQTWEAMGKGMSGGVNALEVDSAGNVYAGGSFKYANNADGTSIEVNNIAKWNTALSTWEPMASGLSGPIRAVKVSSSGIYATGGPNFISKWNGSSWSTVGNGLNSSAFALAADPAGNIYVGGFFTTAYNPNGSPVQATRIAKWNVQSNSWEQFGYGLGNPVDFSAMVNAIALDKAGNPCAGGSFAGVPNHLARWNPDFGLWLPIVASGEVKATSPPIPSISALVIDSLDNIYIGGIFTSPGSNLARTQ